MSAAITGCVNPGSSRKIIAKDFADAEQALGQLNRILAGRIGERAQPRRHGIAHVDRRAVLVDARDVAHPGRDAERQAVDRRLFAQPVADGAEKSLRQLLRTVHGDLPGAMLQRRVLESLDKRFLVVGQIGAGRHVQRRRDLLCPSGP